MKLNIGGGDIPIEGYELIDRTVGREAYPLDVEDESCDEIRASHILEHFPGKDIFDVMQNWYKKLKPGGLIKIAVPNVEWISSTYLSNGYDRRMLRNFLMGSQTDENDFHKTAFDYDMLHTLMEGVGFHSIKPWRDPEINDCASLDCSLNLQGTKPLSQPFPYKLHAVMSTPRLGFMENMFCAAQVIVHRGIPLTKTTGCWWHHCLERVAEDVIKEGAEWIITLDYDTVFTERQFQHMARLVMTYPEIDALAPWQVKREGEEALTWIDDGNGQPRRSLTQGEMWEDIMPAKTAHFGLTWLKAEALQKMPHPWFHEIPDPNGRWGDGRHDPDIYFWKNFRECGLKLFMANQVGIGHLQQLISWPGRNLRPKHQYITDFQKNGLPNGVIK